jgi:hypothetical protein
VTPTHRVWDHGLIGLCWMCAAAPVMSAGLPEKKKKLSDKVLKPMNWSKIPNHAIKGVRCAPLSLYPRSRVVLMH